MEIKRRDDREGHVRGNEGSEAWEGNEIGRKESEEGR